LAAGLCSDPLKGLTALPPDHLAAIKGRNRMGEKGGNGRDGMTANPPDFKTWIRPWHRMTIDDRPKGRLEEVEF